MRRLPDSPPRIARKLRFPILFFLGVDLALLGLLVVVFTTPLNPNYPTGNPIHSDNVPRIAETITLPPATHSTPPASPRSIRVPRTTPVTHRPLATRTAAPATPAATLSPIPVTTTKPPRPTDTATPTPTDTGSPQPS